MGNSNNSGDPTKSIGTEGFPLEREDDLVIKAVLARKHPQGIFPRRTGSSDEFEDNTSPRTGSPAPTNDKD